jgi:hypothetical protein
MKSQTIWIVAGGLVLFYLYNKSKTATGMSTPLTQNEYYAGTAAGVIEDLF